MAVSFHLTYIQSKNMAPVAKPSKMLADFRQRIVSVSGSLVWTMSSNQERWHSQFRRAVYTAIITNWSLWLLAQMSVTVDRASFVCGILLQEGNFTVFAIPGTDRTTDVCITPNPLFPVVVCPYSWHDDFDAGEPSKHSCSRVPCWKNYNAQNKQQDLQWTSTNVRAGQWCRQSIGWGIWNDWKSCSTDQCAEPL